MSWDDDGLKSNPKSSKIVTPAAPDPAVERKALFERFKKIIPEISDNAANQLTVYHSELVRFNKAVNLVSPATIPSAENVHFADSALASRLIVKAIDKTAPLYDVGSGNGFPGLVFAVLYPDVKVVLIERDKRKAEFIKHIASVLSLKNATVEPISVEDLPAGSVRNMVSRGFAPLHKALLVCRRQVLRGGRYFHLKGDAWATELANVPSQLFTFWSPSLLGQYKLPGTTADLAVVMTEKIGE
ncbi:MAG: class I SAM-dependent methyltransferase [Bdellovibrionaceae bacterium]|nr:class I SAM-dependent methyltransferase [Pseudobdellovibrionaceae bacterium]